MTVIKTGTIHLKRIISDLTWWNQCQILWIEFSY